MNKVILIVIDACRPDGLLKARTPNLDALIDQGVVSLKMQSVVSLPGLRWDLASKKDFRSNSP